MTLSSKQVRYLAVAIYVTALVGTTAGIMAFGVARLDQATALQCRTHDWPMQAHQVHMDWCKANGYSTK